MKFDCGSTRAEKERAAALADHKARLAAQRWHPHFALIPRRVGPNDCRWLETIERRWESSTAAYFDAGLVAVFHKWYGGWRYRAMPSLDDAAASLGDQA